MDKTSRYLSGQLLLALPFEEDNEFHESIVYICRHDADGAMGFVINQRLEGLFLHDLLVNLEESFAPAFPAYLATQSPVFWGGPVDMNRGFVLHTLDYQHEETMCIDHHYGITSTPDVLKAISFGEDRPKHYSLLLGYAGWGAGQLEKEMRQYGWLTLPATEHLLFEVPYKKRWKAALDQIGIDGRFFSPVQGNA